MEVNPYSILEVTLTESPPHEVITNEDPLSIDTQTQPPFETERLSGSFLLNQVIENSQKLATLSVEESAYRCHLYRNLDVILQKRLHCSICEIHIGCYAALNLDNVTHPLLAVLTCPSCTLKYRYIDFPITPDGHDVRCRWCGVSATDANPLRFCIKCPFAFCEKCISRNLPLEVSNKINWICCVCNLNLLWPLRGMLWALMTYVIRSESTTMIGDVSHCCRAKRKRQINKSLQPVIQPVRHLPVNGKNKINGDLHSAQPLQHNLIPLDKLIIETAWIKQKLYLLSSLLGKMNEMVNSTAAEMSSYGRADLVKSKVENVTSFISVRAEQLAASCNVLTSDFNRRLDDARTVIDEGLQKNEDKTVQQPSQVQNIPVDLGQLQSVSSNAVLLQDARQYLGLASNESPSVTKDITTENLANENNVTNENSVINNNINDTIKNNKSKRNNIASSKKSTKSKKITLKSPRINVNKKTISKENVEIDEKTISNSSDDIVEFEGVPIKKCYVKLTRINYSLPSD